MRALQVSAAERLATYEAAYASAHLLTFGTACADIGTNYFETYNLPHVRLVALNIMQISLTGSNFYNGVTFLGAIQFEVQDTAGNWAYVTQWSTSNGSSKGIYVMFNGRNMAYPLVRGVKGIRLSWINGATAFRMGMLNLTAR